ncbi:MAG: hypothetical protein ACM30G_06405 [Micromonosporaceae bacterium]
MTTASTTSTTLDVGVMFSRIERLKQELAVDPQRANVDNPYA